MSLDPGSCPELRLIYEGAGVSIKKTGILVSMIKRFVAAHMRLFFNYIDNYAHMHTL